jgi:hypothetical protein
MAVEHSAHGVLQGLLLLTLAGLLPSAIGGV